MRGTGRKLMRYGAEHGVEVLDHLVVPKPFHPKAVTPKKSRAYLIGGHACFEAMLTSVKLDDELCFKAHEVNDVRPDRLLTAKFDACEAAVTK